MMHLGNGDMENRQSNIQMY